MSDLIEGLNYTAAILDANKDKFPVPDHITVKAARLREVAKSLAAKDAEIARLREALEAVLIGGNHLALLIGVDHPAYTDEPLDALTHYGAGDNYEIWCCWRSIMLARQALSNGHVVTYGASHDA